MLKRANNIIHGSRVLRFPSGVAVDRTRVFTDPAQQAVHSVLLVRALETERMRVFCNAVIAVRAHIWNSET